MKRVFNWKPDLPDKRDFKYETATKKFPQIVNLRAYMPKIEDQGSLGSCTANAIVGAVEYLDRRYDNSYSDLSRLFVYYNERAMMGTVNEDSGAYIRDGIKTLTKQGICLEATWPYKVAGYKRKPSTKAYTEAASRKAVSYYRVEQQEKLLLGALADGYPVVFGFTVYENFDSPTVAKTGKLTMPKPGMEMLGGHAVLAVGYNLKNRTFYVRNSWGSSWGTQGYFTMPFEYLLDSDLSEDFWVVKRVTNVK